MNYEALIIGTSAGGLKALSCILAALPADYPLPIIVVQHLSASADDFLPHHLDGLCSLSVKEACLGDRIVAGNVFIAPRGYHLLVEMSRQFSLCVDLPVNYAIPSIDVLFESASDVYREKLIAMLLTGANNDGAAGLKLINSRGGLTIVQEPSTAEYSAMPEAAIAMSKIDHIIALDKIGKFITNISNGE